MPTINLNTEDFQDLEITPTSSNTEKRNVILTHPVGLARIKWFAVHYTHDEHNEPTGDHGIASISYLDADAISTVDAPVEFCGLIGNDDTTVHLAAKNKGLQRADVSESPVRYEHIEFYLTDAAHHYYGQHATRITKIRIALKPNASQIPVISAYDEFRSQPSPVIDPGQIQPIAGGTITPNPTEESNNE